MEDSWKPGSPVSLVMSPVSAFHLVYSDDNIKVVVKYHFSIEIHVFLNTIHVLLVYMCM